MTFWKICLQTLTFCCTLQHQHHSFFSPLMTVLSSAQEGDPHWKHWCWPGWQCCWWFPQSGSFSGSPEPHLSLYQSVDPDGCSSVPRTISHWKQLLCPSSSCDLQHPWCFSCLWVCSPVSSSCVSSPACVSLCLFIGRGRVQ